MFTQANAVGLHGSGYSAAPLWCGTSDFAILNNLWFLE